MVFFAVVVGLGITGLAGRWWVVAPLLAAAAALLAYQLRDARLEQRRYGGSLLVGEDLGNAVWPIVWLLGFYAAWVLTDTNLGWSVACGLLVASAVWLAASMLSEAHSEKGYIAWRLPMSRRKPLYLWSEQRFRKQVDAWARYVPDVHGDGGSHVAVIVFHQPPRLLPRNTVRHARAQESFAEWIVWSLVAERREPDVYTRWWGETDVDTRWRGGFDDRYDAYGRARHLAREVRAPWVEWEELPAPIRRAVISGMRSG